MFKVFIEFVIILLLFYVLVFLSRRLSSRSRDGTHRPCIGRRGLNHWASGEVSLLLLSHSNPQLLKVLTHLLPLLGTSLGVMC